MLRIPRVFVSVAPLIAALIPLTFLPAAQADEWGDQDSSTGAHPDEDPHSYCYASSVPSGLRDQIYNAQWNALDPTEVNVDYHSTCTLSGSSETDVYWREENLSGLYGKAPCNDYETFSNQCDQYHVTLDRAAIDVGTDDGIHRTIVACHELGHTAGLSHRDGNCMRATTPDNPPTELKYRRYDPYHHIPDHINPWF